MAMITSEQKVGEEPLGGKTKMQISREQAQELLDLSVGQSTAAWRDFGLNFELMETNIIDTTRWSVVYDVVYRDNDTDKYWYSSYYRGATEMQDECPYEYDEFVTLMEVEPIEVKRIEYQAVINGNE